VYGCPLYAGVLVQGLVNATDMLPCCYMAFHLMYRCGGTRASLLQLMRFPPLHAEDFEQLTTISLCCCRLAVQVWWHQAFSTAVDVLRYSPDGSRLAAAGHDKVVEVYDITPGGLRR
jgi:hypothetical protein